ncbi:MAG: gliding motility-associated ABC transporter permease subunit GldF, partial [Prolixibacteraceae bacterium]|nr:gliding motility-associated ABC transporter permease subunit GldF [Prolixibacteraceae bacterium]
MYSLFKKEIKIFLGSLTGYLAILVFLLVSGLFLWLFPGAYNIPDSGYATLDGFFQLAPWLYLFLVPAITMRFFADEKRSGTLELLLTRPVKDVQLVAAKFFAGLVLVVFSLLPTLLYFLSVYLLGVPVGSIDTGATWGSFIGLFFLAAIYVAIGVFASALTGNQIVAFIFAMLLSFLFYLGFDFIGSTGIAYGPEQLFSWLSIHNHYLSISRGVVDLRDLIYFIGMTSLFVFFTGTILRKGEWKQRKTITRAILFFAGWVIVFLASANFLIRVDLTSDKRFSLSGVSKQIVSEMKNPVDVEIFLAGELEPGLRKLQDEIVEKIAVLNVYSSASIRVKIFNPYSIANAQKRKKFIENIVQKGIKPTSFRHKTEKGVTTKLIFPGALIHSKGKEIGVNFLKYNPDFSHELNFNHSVESVEFELINAFRKLMRKKKTTVAFLEGQQELNKYEVLDFSHALSADFQVKRLTVSELAQKSDSVAVLIVANPHQPFTEKEKLIIDQYIMKGGKVVW